MKYLMSLCLLVFAWVGYAGTIPLTEGKDYLIIKSAESNTPQPGEKIQVIEFFNYGCPWCYSLEAKLSTWLANKPKDVEFYRVPVVFESGWDIYARAYYVANALKIADKISPKLFDAIHKEHKNLADEKAMEAFFIANGVSAKDFHSAYHASPTIDMDLNHGLKMIHDFEIYEVPTIVINQKYKVNPRLAASDNQRLLGIVDYLIQLERIEKQKKSGKF